MLFRIAKTLFSHAIFILHASALIINYPPIDKNICLSIH
ncbi:hypothetical protein C1G86_0007 [Dehalococcoides mccartyi]|uniref:Uncharacterized protein n=1 Tax=Dehalococcoides mccartyi TaxID=61435 RepID=A0A142VC80_9CHLR|nr:hypothetical protein Dm11a5_1546 [Dehalococcoides mccartyi]AOW00017.1 hypothetical protein DCWBC2_1410 [Dehalococcoides mccartyi]MBA2084381.1 hypothetical protein [Dehalococcoides mccartyi]RAL69903.1 hypothetical protein C1G87_0042 [Dehalococcoides mccartyi]RAL71083.1 hypothetical protein C1G86_0007 [Dehalococcoides mccartyi]